MSEAFDRVFEHVSKTIQAPPSATITKFPALSARRFRDVDATGGARGELEEQVGQDRVFEIAIDDLSLTPVLLGGATVSAYDLSFPIRVRYEGAGPHRQADTTQQIVHDLAAVVDALTRSSWSSIAGVASFRARPGNLTRFVISDDAGNSYEGYIGSVLVDASVDI